MPAFFTLLSSLSSYSSLFPSLSGPQAAPFNIIFSFLHPQTPHHVSCLLALLDTYQRASLYTANLEFVFKTSLIADKVRFPKAEVLEVMLYGCVTWTLSPGDFDKLREAHPGMLPRCLNAYTSTRAAPDYHMLSCLEVLLRTDCECIEATVMKHILHYAGRVARMHDDRLSNIVMRGWSGGRENGASLRNASNIVSRNTALPSESTPSVG